jgi:urease accessory protein
MLALPGITVFQTDIAQYVNASLDIMDRDSKLMRGDGPTIFCSVKEGKGVEDVANLILAAWRTAGNPGKPGAIGDLD